MGMIESASSSGPSKPTMFCIGCDYVLDGLSEHRCPECGRVFDPEDRKSYRSKARGWWWVVRQWLLRLFKIATLLFVLLGLIFGWFYWRYSVEQRSVARIRELGGAVSVKPLESRKLRRWADRFRISIFDTVFSVDLRGSDFNFGYTSDGDTDFENIKAFSDLQRLMLTSTKITDASLAHFKELRTLRILALNDTGITDAGLVHLEGLTNLESLGLIGTKVTDEGISHLTGLANLHTLRLHQTHVTDRGLVPLGTMTDLFYLSLGNSKITDAGLLHLKRLKKLGILELFDTKVTEKGLADLKRALPDLAIYVNGEPCLINGL